MATQAQAYFVMDLAVQTGVLGNDDFDACHADVLTWDNREVTAAIDFLKDRQRRSRIKATAKQIDFGTTLNMLLAEQTDSEPEDLDFEQMTCLEATETITRLEALHAMLTALDTSVQPAAGQSAPEQPPADLQPLLRLLALQNAAKRNAN